MTTKTNEITETVNGEAHQKSGFEPIKGTSTPISGVNDIFRSTFEPSLGVVTMTPGVQALRDPAAALKAVQNFSDFTTDNDSYGEHDFGSIVVENSKIFWKIDYYDNNFEFRSENPSDLNETKRVLTVMLASEY